MLKKLLQKFKKNDKIITRGRIMDLIKGLFISLIIFFGFGCNRGMAPKEEIKIDSAVQQEITQGKSSDKSYKTYMSDKSSKSYPEQKEPSNQEEPYEGTISAIQEEPMESEPKEIKWYFSFEEGLKAGKKEGKPLMVDFEASWCGWCKKLDATTYQDAEVIALSKKFIPVKVDYDTDHVTPQKYGVRGLPTIIFMDSDGQILHQIGGYRGPEDFIAEMKKAIKL